MNKKSIPYSVLMLLCSVLSTAQKPPKLIFHHLDSRNGLSDPTLQTTFEDSYGFIWIGSANGLTRFDGINCNVYRHIDTDTLSICANYIVKIIEDKNRDLWIGTQNGLARYNRTKDNFTNFQQFKTDKQLAPNFYAYPFFIDNKNSLWAFLGGYIYKIDTKNRYAQFVSDYANGIVATQQNSYTPLHTIYGNLDKGIVVTPLLNNKPIKNNFFFTNQAGKAHQPALDVYNMLPESDSLLWLCTNKGLIELNPVTHQYSTYNTFEDEKSFEVNCILPYPNVPSLYLIGTSSKGILLFDKEKRKYTFQYTHDPLIPQSLSGNNVKHILCDKNDNIFTLIAGRGMDYTNLYQSQFSAYFTPAAALKLGIENNVSALVSNSDNRFYLCGTPHNGIVVFENETGKAVQRLLQDKGIELIVSIKNDRFLVSCDDGSFMLIYLRNNRWKNLSLLTKKALNHKGKTQFHQIVRLSDTTFIAATGNGATLLKLGEHSLETQFITSINNNVSWPNVQQIIPLPNKQFLVQSFFTNLYLFSMKKDTFVNQKEIARTPFQTNGTVVINDKVYLATSLGLWIYEINTQKLYATGQKDLYLTGISKDNKGNLWMSSTAGMIKYNIHNKAVFKFNLNDGLQHTTFNANALFTCSDGNIIAGGINGFNKFNPDVIVTNQEHYKVLINNIEVNDKLYKEAFNPLTLQSLHLSYQQNTIAFTVSPLSYTKPQELSVFYMLKGYDTKLISGKGMLAIRYPKLPPGKYEFIAYGFNGSTVTRLSIIITPPFWKTWGFIVVAITLCVLLVFLIIKIRIKDFKAKQLARMQLMIQSQEIERKRIARDLHDDFGARLSALKMYIQSIGKQGNNKDAGKYAAEMIDLTISELRNILFNLSPKTLDENGLAASLHHFSDNCNRILDLHCEVNTDAYNTPMNVSVEFSLYRIFQELINNTIKHAEAKNVYISLVTHEKEVVFLYEDDGKGFNITQIKRGYGWNNIELYAKAVFSTLDIDSSPGRGTAVTIHVPYNKKTIR